MGFFFGGVISSGLLLGGMWLSRRFLTPTPDAALRLVHKRLANDGLLQRRLGSPIQYGEFRAYTYKGGFHALGYSPRTAAAPSPSPKARRVGLLTRPPNPPRGLAVAPIRPAPVPRAAADDCAGARAQGQRHRQF